MTMKILAILVAICFSANALAQNAPPKISSKPVHQAKPKEPTGCKIVGSVRGTKIWAGDCTASGLRGSAPAEEAPSSTKPANEAAPPAEKQ
jgi:hypothetical protein